MRFNAVIAGVGVLAQRECAGGSCGEGIDPGSLNYVEALSRAQDPAPRLVVYESHTRQPVQVAGEVAVAPIYGVENDAIELDRRDVPAAEHGGRQHIAATT